MVRSTRRHSQLTSSDDETFEVQQGSSSATEAAGPSSKPAGSVTVEASKQTVQRIKQVVAEAAAAAAPCSSSDEEELIRLQPSDVKKTPAAKTSGRGAKAATMLKDDGPSDAKKPKVALASIFMPKQPKVSPDDEPSYTADGNPLLVWRSPLTVPGRTAPTLLLGTYGEPWKRVVELARSRDASTAKGSVRIAAFDLDGTIVVPRQGTWPSQKDPKDYKYVFTNVVERVKKEHESGSVIVIVSNQKQSANFTITAPPLKYKTWQEKLRLITRELGVPLLVMAALADDAFRKPCTAMWTQGIVGSFGKAGGQEAWIARGPTRDDGGSFFVGDASGRLAAKSRAADHSDTDRKWAINLGLPFFTPEEYFQDAKAEPFELTGWRPVFDHEPAAQPDGLVPDDEEQRKKEIIVFVGPPASGKTAFYRRVLEPAGYRWINQDTLGRREKCIKEAERALREGSGVVIDKCVTAGIARIGNTC